MLMNICKNLKISLINLDFVLTYSKKKNYNIFTRLKGGKMNDKNCNWGGKRQYAGRKKSCFKKVPFNRRINEKIINILREYAKEHNLTETEALESAILLQNNISKKSGGQKMKIAIPTLEGKLCGHFGHCETFSFVEVNPETKEILSIKTDAPEEGVSCQSASWVAAQGANIVLVGGIGGRPLNSFEQNGVEVITGCPELDIKEIVQLYLDNTIVCGENACGGKEHHHCGGHGEGHHHHCGGHN